MSIIRSNRLNVDVSPGAVLLRTRRAPRAYASTKEAFSLRLGTILEFAGISPHGLYKMVDPLSAQDPIDDEWAQAMCDIVRRMLDWQEASKD